MKFDSILLIFAFFFILAPSIFAVECSSSDMPYFEIECPACTFYICGKKNGAGCPDDFFHDCSNFGEAIKFIDSKNYLYLNYFDGFVTYISGCEQELDGQPCLRDKKENFEKEIEKYESGILWNNSNCQKSAFKVIGIIGIAWIFVIFVL
uniref:Uncharacterized protein n=1 Tax=Panagrolaimus superbus TaxID=310955 RepID=A0A914YGH4_9BILA